jgi:molybdenum cofactor cytidylyltransferase
VKGLSVIILAAGAARRIKQAKMLLPFEHSTILQTILARAKDIEPDTICVVTGFYHKEILQIIHDEQVHFIFNEQWEEGMSGSIKKGLSYLVQQNPELQSVLIMVADQPYITSALLKEMITLQEQGQQGIIAASYAGIHGTPVLFRKNYFSSLENLVGDKGARSILQHYPDDLVTVGFPLGEIDIDTEEDYKKIVLK